MKMDNLQTLSDKLKSLYAASPVYLQHIYQIVAAISVAILIWMAVKFIIHRLENRLKKYSFFKENHRVFELLRQVMGLSLILITGSYLLRLFNILFLNNLFYAVFVILLANPIKDFLFIAIEYLKNNLADKTETKVDNIIFDLLYRFAGVIIYITASIIALDVLGINVMPFIAGAGVMGIAIGFAAKDTLSNLIAGILLIIDRPFEVGDRIEVWSAPAGSSTWGDVIDIGLRATKIRTTDNIVIIIPNNEIMMRDIVNYTIITSKIRVRVNIGVAFDADIQKAKAIIVEAAKTAEWISKAPEPKVVVRNFGESSVDLQLRVWIDNARKRMDTISYITDRVKEAFDKNGIEIPYPKRDIYVKQA